MPTQVGNLVVFGDIELKWLAIGGLAGPLGQPVTNEAPTFDGVGREQKFQGGFVSWHPDAGVRAHIVWGLIGERWSAIGREQFGYPVTDELDFPGGGKYNTFRAMQIDGHPEGTIAWKPGTTAAWEVYGAIRQGWINAGSVLGPLHYPLDHERPAFDGRGRFQHFEGGILSWHPDTPGGPFIVWGLIGERWLRIGREQFGYPVTNEMTLPDGGKYNTFRAMQIDGHPEATIVWKPGTMVAWEVYGAIRDQWISMGGTGGPLGYPVQEERPVLDGEGRYQLFERGSISWQPGIGTRVAEYRPWAIILCRFKGEKPDPALEGPIEKFYREAFTPGTGGLIEYWRDVSLGAIDITGSRVFGWVEVDLPRSQAGGTASSTPPGPGRSGLINYAIQAVKRGGGENVLDGLLGPIAVYTRNWSKDGAPPGADWSTPGWFPFWIDGSADGAGRVALTPPHNGNITAHEMGHVFGMGHDVGPDLSTGSDYSDPSCIMSQNGSFVHPTWSAGFGPAVCLPHLVQRNWMIPSRLYYDDGGWLSEPDGITLPLAPINCPDARANLGIMLAFKQDAAQWDYYLEYVIPEEWNRGVAGAPYLFIRRIVTISGVGDRPAYLGYIVVPATVGQVAEFVEPSGNVRFQIELTDLAGPILKVSAKKR
jgi:hypothetical protein